MKIHEYVAREIFQKYGVRVPEGSVATTPEEAKAIAEKIRGPVVLKAQVLVAKRASLGGIVFAQSPDDAYLKARQLFSKEVGGLKVEKILVVRKVDVVRELYVGFTVDRGERAIAFLACSEGGVELEELVKKYPEKLVRHTICPLAGLKDYMIRDAAFKLGLKEHLNEFSRVVKALYSVFVDYDCELAEINPLAVTRDGSLVALDTRMIIDDNALFRHPDLAPPEKSKFSYVELDGDIGVIGNGAGLTMATMDLIAEFGGRPANFLDIGGGAKAEVVKEALTLLLRNPRVKVVFINILGGITRCDEVAKGIIEALKQAPAKPVVVRMMGTREQEGKEILQKAGVECYDDMEEAARRAVEVAREVSR